jgi:hypothetical protein
MQFTRFWRRPRSLEKCSGSAGRARRNRVPLAVENLEGRALPATLLPAPDAAGASLPSALVAEVGTRPAQVDYFLKLKGIDGESATTVPFTLSFTEIEFEARDGGDGAGKVQMQDIYFVAAAAQSALGAEVETQPAQVDYFLKLQSIDGDVIEDPIGGEFSSFVTSEAAERSAPDDATTVTEDEGAEGPTIAVSGYIRVKKLNS